jgi:hypothetical protein
MRMHLSEVVNMETERASVTLLEAKKETSGSIRAMERAPQAAVTWRDSIPILEDKVVKTVWSHGLGPGCF